MLSVKPGGEDNRDEELGAICVRARVGHGKETNLVMLLDKVFVVELFPVDGLAPSAIASREVSSLGID